MSFTRPTLDQIRAVADDLGIDLSDDELTGYLERMEGFSRAYALVDETPDPGPRVRGRTWRRPEPDLNRYNAWFVKTSIREEYRGRLAGKTLAVKDSISVAGLPMMNGASFLEGYVPDADATVVTRALHAGAEIVGKTNCEYLSLSGGSHTGANGPVINRTSPATRRAARHPAAPWPWPRATPTWPWAATRPAPSGCPRPGAASWGSSPATASSLHRHPWRRPGRGPLRPHDTRRARQRIAAGGAGRTRRHGPAPAKLVATGEVHRGATGRRQRLAHSGGQGGFRATQLPSRSR